MTLTAARRESPLGKIALRQTVRNGTLVPYLFIGPALVCLVTFNILAIVVAAAVSLTNLDISGLGNLDQVRFVGLRNYQVMFGDPAFWESFRNTALFVGLGVPTLIIGSLAIAIAVNYSQSWFFLALRAFYFVPALTPSSPCSFTWAHLYPP